MSDMIDSASDDRTANNAVRHQYRVLTDAEKAQMVAIKDRGAALIEYLNTLRTPEEISDGSSGLVMTVGTFDRELNIAIERIEEGVMWAVKHITA